MSVVLCCRDATALLTEDAEGALAGFDRLTFAMHLTICGACRRYRSQLDTTVDVLKAIPRQEPKADEVDAILRMLGEAASEPPDDL